jgi:ABC-type sugar transport system ATPase subunit
MNFVDYRLSDGALVGGLFAHPMRLDQTDESHVVIGIRPERIHVQTTPAPTFVPARVRRSAVVAGGQHLLSLQIDDIALKAKVPESLRVEEGETVYVECAPDDLTLFDADGHRLQTRILA